LPRAPRIQASRSSTRGGDRRLANGESFLGGRAVDHALGIEDRIDPSYRLDRQRGDHRQFAAGLQADVGEDEELAPGMGPAGRLEHRTWLAIRLEEAVEPGIGVGLQDAGEAVEMAFGMLAGAILRIEEHCGRRIGSSEGAIVADICPQPSRPGPALRQDRDRRVVAVHPPGGEHVGSNEVVERPQHDGAGTDLVGQGREAEVDPFQGMALALTVERLMLAVLLEQDHTWARVAYRAVALFEAAGSVPPNLERPRGTAPAAG
jgi:hypothetical protein